MSRSILYSMPDCDVDEIQSERDYFWAIAFPIEQSNRWLVEAWSSFIHPFPLKFSEIHEIADRFDSVIDRDVDYDQLEVFVAQRIWLDKCQRRTFANPEFGEYLAVSPLNRWLYAGVN